MLNYPRLNEISYRIEGFAGNDSNYRITKAELLAEDGEEKWSLTIQRKEDDGKDFMQEILSRIKGYKETIHFRVVYALVNDKKSMVLAFVVEDLAGEEKEDERKE